MMVAFVLSVFNPLRLDSKNEGNLYVRTEDFLKTRIHQFLLLLSPTVKKTFENRYVWTESFLKWNFHKIPLPQHKHIHANNTERAVKFLNR